MGKVVKKVVRGLGRGVKRGRSLARAVKMERPVVGAPRWQLQEAKAKLSEVIDRVVDSGPQVFTRHGEDVAVLMSVKEYQRLKGETPSLVEAFLNMPRVPGFKFPKRDPKDTVGGPNDRSIFE